MSILETRLKNARELAESVGGASRFAERMRMSRQQASHIIGSNPVKGIGHEMARRITEMFDKPEGWLDIDHDLFVSRPLSDTVNIPMLREAGVPDGYRTLEVGKEWVKKWVQATAFEYLALATARGDAMAPTIADGCMLLIDRAQSSFKSDGVYAIANKRELFIHRVQRLPTGGYLLKCDNPLYKELPVSRADVSLMSVMGRVLMAWQPLKL